MDQDRGMTLLEVIVALSLLMIGVMFVLGGNKIVFQAKAQHELRQQMFFYAAGQVEAFLELGTTLPETIPGLQVDPPEVTSVTDSEVNGHLELVKITVRSTTNPNIEPVSIKTLRYLP